MDNIPQSVINKAKNLVDFYGCNFEHLGLYNEKETYKFLFPKNERTGFPFVYLYDKQSDTTEEVTGIKGLKILRFLISCE